MALEVGRLERHGKPTCSECTVLLQGKRGCRKPGMEMKRSLPAARFTSPMLLEAALDECPVGYLLRTSPHTYVTCDALSLIDNATPTEMAAMPAYMHPAARLFRAEGARIAEVESLDRSAKAQGKRDAEYAARRLRQ